MPITYPWYQRGGEPSMSTEATPVTGTANQVVVTTSTGPVISLSTALTFPGSIATTDAVTFTGLATTDPGVTGRVWNSTAGLKVSTGP